MIKIYYCNSFSLEIPEELSNQRKEKILLSKQPKDKLAQINSAKILKSGFNDLGINEKDVIYAEGTNGKPYARDYNKVHFSLSHTNNFSIVAFCENEIGIDCENNQRTISPEITARYFTDSENAAFASSPLTLWVAKEAYVKYTGKGFASGRNGLSLPYFEDELMLDGVWFKKLTIEDHTVIICAGKHDDVQITKVL